jgi:hypothetical protein
VAYRAPMPVAVRLAQQTTTTEVPRVVGEPLPEWVWLLAGLALLVFVLAGGWWATRRQKQQG